MVPVHNTAPTANVAGPGIAVRGQTSGFTIGADDVVADETDGFAYSVNWGDGTPMTSLAAAPGNGFHVDGVSGTNGTLGQLMTSPGSGTTPLFDCVWGGSHFFVQTEPTCGGATNLGTLGWI